MKSLRTFAAQSDYKQRVIKASLGGTALFCLSVVLSQSANADETTQNPVVVPSTDSTNVVVPPQTPPATGSSNPVDLPASTPGQSGTPQDQSGQGQSQENQVPEPSLASISEKIDTATVTVQIAADNATTALQTIPNVVNVVSSLPIAQAAVDSATAVVQTAIVKIGIAQQYLETATVSADLVSLAQAGVASATAVVADKASIVTAAQSNLDTTTGTVDSTQTTLTTAQDAQSALDAAAACVEGSACVHFYTANSELGPLNDQIVIAQQAADAAVVAAPIAQAAADASTVTVTTNGVTATVYYGTGPTPALPSDNTTPILTTTVPQIAFNWGSGSVMGGPADRVIVKFTGTITVPNEAVAVKYAVSSDDGSIVYIDGQLAINNWRDQGTAWSPYSPTYNTTTDKQQNFIIWYYENGGGATCTLGWMVFRADGTGYFTTPGASAFGSTTTTNDPALVAAAAAAQAAIPVTAQAVVDAQAAYDAKLAERNAAYESWQSAIQAVNAGTQAIANAQAAYDLAQQNLTVAQENLTTFQENLTGAQQNLTVQQSVLSIAQTTAARDTAIADTAANDALAAAQIAATALTTAVSTIQDQITLKAAADAESALAAQKAADAQARADAKAAQNAAIAAQQAADKAAADKALADQQAADQAVKDQQAKDAAAKAEVDAAQAKADADKAAADAVKAAEDKAAADKAAADAKAAAEKSAADAAKAEADKAAAQKAADDAKKTQTDTTPKTPDPGPTPPPPPPVVVVTEKTTAETYVPAVAPEKYMAPEAIKAFKEIGIVPNNPAQLPTTIPKAAPVEVLVAHVQVDVTGVENGGIQFFGTKSAPQVVQEDGKLTPPAPPPGSGLPIPPEAITTADTFIGQPGGTSFNAPDIAVPVIETPVTGAIAAVPGAQALNHAFVAMSNIGNDMSPVTRKKAKKILVLTVAVGAIVRRKFGS